MIAQMAALANAQEMYIIPFKTRVLDTRQGFSVQNILYYMQIFHMVRNMKFHLGAYCVTFGSYIQDTKFLWAHDFLDT